MRTVKSRLGTYYLKDAEMKIAMYDHFKEKSLNHKNNLKVDMVLRDAAFKLETVQGRVQGS